MIAEDAQGKTVREIIYELTKKKIIDNKVARDMLIANEYRDMTICPDFSLTDYQYQLADKYGVSKPTVERAVCLAPKYVLHFA